LAAIFRPPRVIIGALAPRAGVAVALVIMAAAEYRGIDGRTAIGTICVEPLSIQDGVRREMP